MLILSDDKDSVDLSVAYLFHKASSFVDTCMVYTDADEDGAPSPAHM
jgi:hypothetical protein